MSQEHKKQGQKDILVQVKSQQSQRHNVQQPGKSVESEVCKFLQLLSNTKLDSPQKQLSPIFSIGSEHSNPSQKDEINLTYLQDFAWRMRIHIQKQLTTENKQILDSFYELYLEQMTEIDKLIQYSYDVGAKGQQQRVSFYGSHSPYSELEKELQNQLRQAQQLNDQLHHLLKSKTQENYFKERQCKSALEQLRIIQEYIQQFQGHFKQFNYHIKSLNIQLAGSLESSDKKKTVHAFNSRKSTQVNTFRSQFNATPPRKSLVEEYQTQRSAQKSRSSNSTTPKKFTGLEKVYRQIQKHYN